MKSKLVNESLRDFIKDRRKTQNMIEESGISEGIPWSGVDVTKAPIIGKLKAVPIPGFDNDNLDYDVVEVVEANGHKFYICNFWYKYGVPQVISDSMVEEYIEYKSPIEQDDPEGDFKRRWGSESI